MTILFGGNDEEETSRLFHRAEKLDRLEKLLRNVLASKTNTDRRIISRINTDAEIDVTFSARDLFELNKELNS